MKRGHKELARIVGHEENSELLRKKVSIIKDGKQFSVRIPIKFAELTEINYEVDSIEFILIPIIDKTSKYKYTLKSELVRGKDEH